MTITVDLQPNCRANLHATVPADVVKQERATVLATIAKSVSIPGFRPGKVPASVVAQRYASAVGSELEQALVNKACAEAVKRENLRVLTLTEVSNKKFEADGTFLFSAVLLLAPEVALPEYKGIPVKLERVEVSDHDVEHEIYHLRERAAKFEDVERPAEKGDIVVLSYVVRADGELTSETMPALPEIFRQMKGNWFELGESENFVPGFVDGLLGIVAGEKRLITSVVPADFHDEQLRGKTLEFDVECSGVKIRNMPELNDELAQQFLPEGSTVETLREEVRKAINTRKEQARDQTMSDQILAYLDQQLVFDLPQEMVDQEAQRRTNEITVRAARQGMENDAILGMQDKIIETASTQARQSVKVSFILAEVARREKLEVSDAMLSMQITQMALRNGQQPKNVVKELQKQGSIERLREDLLLQSALRLLKEHAAVEEVDPVATAHGCEFEKGTAA